MHFQKSWTVFCVAACIGASSLNLRADDTDVQARAREALHQAMAGQTGQTNAPTAPPVVVVPPAEQSAPAAPAAVPAPAAPATSSVSGNLTPEQEAKVREALRQAMAGQGGQQPTAPVVAQPAVATPVQSQPVVNVPEAAPQAPAVVSTTSANPGAPHQLTPEEQQRVLEAERTELARLRTTDAKQNAETTKPKVTPVKSVVTPTSSSVPSTTMAPAPGSKEQRLNQLLELYKADKITPTEYHQERAKIMAE